MIPIRDGLSIPDACLDFQTSRSSGPGGQNVNKVETKVELRLDLDAWHDLPERIKERLRTIGRTRLIQGRFLRFLSSRHREQSKNRAACEERLRELVLAALVPPPPPRLPTRPPVAAKRKRLDAKRQRSESKGGRSWKWDGE